MSLQDVEARDKRRSAIHEAGHVVVAFVHGSLFRAWLERTGTDAPRFEKTWIGHAENEIGGYNADVGALIGVAGAIADALADDPNLAVEDINEMWETEPISGPSPADLELLPKDPKEQVSAIKMALAILSKQWTFLESIVAELVKYDKVSADRVAILAAFNMVQE
jgi:hypothetical protein